MVATFAAHIDHAGLLVGTTARSGMAGEAKAGLLAAASQEVAAIAAYHAMRLVGTTARSGMAGVAKARKYATSIRMVAAAPVP